MFHRARRPRGNRPLGDAALSEFGFQLLRPTAQHRPDGVLEDRISTLIAPEISECLEIIREVGRVRIDVDTRHKRSANREASGLADRYPLCETSGSPPGPGRWLVMSGVRICRFGAWYSVWLLYVLREWYTH